MVLKYKFRTPLTSIKQTGEVRATALKSITDWTVLKILCNFSEELTASTLTTQESSPDILDARTDKLGTKIKIKYNLELNQPVESLKNYFQLTEDNNPRLITGISIVVTNP